MDIADAELGDLLEDSAKGGKGDDTQLDDLLENSEGADAGWNSC